MILFLRSLLSFSFELEETLKWFDIVVKHSLKTVFDYHSKHLQVRPKYSAVGRNCNSLVGV